ncbi:unnamed protein product, partial [Phaeothamnion confervicola]
PHRNAHSFETILGFHSVIFEGTLTLESWRMRACLSSASSSVTELTVAVEAAHAHRILNRSQNAQYTFCFLSFPTCAALVHLRRGEVDEAVASFTRVLELSPTA